MSQLDVSFIAGSEHIPDQEEVDLLLGRELTVVDESLATVCKALYGDLVSVEFNVVDGTHIVRWDVPDVDKPEDLEAFVLEHLDTVSNSAAAGRVRKERNALLQGCDWTQLVDIPKETQAAFKAYRQALRDLPEQNGFPNIVEWPIRPTTK